MVHSVKHFCSILRLQITSFIAVFAANSFLARGRYFGNYSTQYHKATKSTVATFYFLRTFLMSNNRKLCKRITLDLTNTKVFSRPITEVKS